MSNAVSVEVAQAVTDQLAAATLSQTINPERNDADWELAMEEASDLHVDVVAVTTDQKIELSSRSTVCFTVPVDIAVRRRFGNDKQDAKGRVNIAEVDALKLLVQEIFLLFIPQRLTEFPAGAWEETKISVCPLVKHLKDNKQFTGIVRVTFRVDQTINPAA